MQRMIATGFSIGILMLAASAVLGQAGSAGSGLFFPIKTIRIVTAESGSGNDIMARLIATGIAGSMGQAVIVDNRGMTAIEITAKSPPDGYTLLSFGPPLWIMPLMRGDTSWNPVRDFAPITLAMSTFSILAVHPSLPVKSVSELLALARAKPGELNYAGTFPGSSAHLAGELFKFMAGVNIVYVPYKGPASALAALMGGETHVTFANSAATMPHVKSGRLRALAITSALSSALAPGLPTVAAAGLPGYESASPLGLFAPARTPDAIIARLNQEMVKVLNAADVKDRLSGSGAEVIASAPEELAATIKADMTRLGRLIREAGIRAD